MLKKKFLTGLLALSLIIPGISIQPQETKAAETAKVLEATEVSNPIGGYDSSGSLVYGGDPSVLVDGDTVYLYEGQDVSDNESYQMPGYIVYSTKDLKNWKYHGRVLTMTDVKWGNAQAAWAGQVEKGDDGKYYMFYCSWASVDSGNQSIGVAVSDTPTGKFKDIGDGKGDLTVPFIKGSVTTSPSSNFNDIDPTVYTETINGETHHYLSWGNGKFFICEIEYGNGTVSVKDINNDGKITFGTDKTKADILEHNPSPAGGYTEAPWLYRRKDAEGNPYGDYYVFYAYQWREAMAYSRAKASDGLLSNKWTFGKMIMPPTATSNTNHMAVFDFKGDTYFIYHNGSLPGGSGFRRIPNIAKLEFDEDGNINEIPETVIGISDSKATNFYSSDGFVISHAHFDNSFADGDYPNLKVNVSESLAAEQEDTDWVIQTSDASALPTTDNSIVKIQSNNKPGLYLTAYDDKTIKLAQNTSLGMLTQYNAANPNEKINENYANNAEKLEAWRKMQSFETVNGLNDSENEKAVSFKSISQPGLYITAVNGELQLTDGSDKAAATFYIDEKPEVPAGASTNSNMKSVEDISGKYKFTKTGNTFTTVVPFETASIDIKLTAEDSNAYVCEDTAVSKASTQKTISITADTVTKKYTVLANDRSTKTEYVIVIKKEKPDYSKLNLKSKMVKSFTFDGTLNGAIAVQKAAVVGAPVAVTSPKYTYETGVVGKAISLDGSYGLKLFENLLKSFGGSEEKPVSDYSISFWMKPNVIGGVNDPVLTAGLFSPEWWLNLSFDAKVWSRRGAYINTPAADAYKAGVWQNVVLTVEGNKEDASQNSTAKLYVDGVLVSSGEVEKDIMNLPTGAMYFGINAWDGIFNGDVDEITCYNSTLSVTEVSALASKNMTISSILGSNTSNLGEQKTAATPTTTKKTVAAKKVTASVKKYPLVNNKLVLKKGKKATIKAVVTPTGASQKVKYSSSNKKVATVSSKGVIKGKKAGSAKITIKTTNGKKTVIKVKVVNKNKKNKVLKLKASKKTIKKGASYQIAIKKITSNTTSTISYKSSAKSKASVDNTGLVTAKKKGKATITVKCGKAKKTIKIVVK